MAEKRIYINGISGVTGEYLVPPVDYTQAAALVKGEGTDPGLIRWLQYVWRTISQPHLGLPMDADPADVGQAGWGIVFHTGESQAVKDALAPLIDHRRGQVGEAKTKVLEYRPNDTWRDWLGRHGVAAGSVIPTKVPYYVLLVGDPAGIPYSFQYLLDVEYAVGRLSFDTPDEYRRYVESLIDYETGASVPHEKTAVFFGTRHAFDGATALSADLLVKPLADGIPAAGTHPAQPGVAERWGFATRKLWGEGATKANLSEVFRGLATTKPPAFVFSATHGMGWPKGDPDQLAKQGSLLCQDWPGFGYINESHYYTGADLPDDARVHGMITFHFACYGAGTPERDNFFHEPGQLPPQIANRPFVAMLPKRLLAQPQGGALAVVGHIERAWGYSIVTPLGGPQLLPYQNTIGRILVGQPVGHALKDFNERYAALSASLSGILEEIRFGAHVSDDELAAAWIERNDAQNYIIVGDPAARLRIEAMS
jgi:hypothetical protein